MAAYDTVIDRIICGYAQLSNVKIHGSSGGFIILFNRFIGEFDDELEQRIAAHQPTGFDEILDTSRAGDRLDDVVDFLSPFPGKGEAVRSYL